VGFSWKSYATTFADPGPLDEQMQNASAGGQLASAAVGSATQPHWIPRGIGIAGDHAPVLMPVITQSKS
jgi:hypothetical protein